jgi:hypothetical protein
LRRRFDEDAARYIKKLSAENAAQIAEIAKLKREKAESDANTALLRSKLEKKTGKK